MLAAAAVFALQKLAEGLVLSYRGLAKFVDYTHKTYLCLWDVVMIIIRMTIFLLIALVIFYFAAHEEHKRLAYEWSVKTAPTIQLVANRTLDGLAKLHGVYFGKETNKLI